MNPASERATAGDARALPTGTVTFLFTDIEGSTQRWEAHRDAMKEAVARHDSLLRDAIGAAGGHIFKTIGDAFCAAFPTAPMAIAAALEIQRRLASEDFSAVEGLRVRCALNSGYADEREGDYFGSAVNRVARLLAIGHGGQILAASATGDLARDEMPPNSHLRDLGAHRLKDLSQPERVMQLVAEGLPAEFPPLRSLDALPNNLPLQVTSFVGRERDVETIKSLLQANRLVSLVGAAGSGKTRLGLQVAAELLDRYPDGVWLIELANLVDPDLVASELALAINVRLSSDRSLVDSIVHAIGTKKTLLIFDNCEHLISSVAKIVRGVLQHCPHVGILITSREGLGISGENVFRVGSLDLPAKEEELSADQALAYGAVVLFRDRANSANKTFSLDDQNATLVTHLCRRLDGIPFAIELAAARLRALSLGDLAKALNERFRVLTGGDRTGLPRQQTMRALIDWSYDSLAEPEQRLLRRCAVFAGGWTLESATAICTGDGIDALDVLDLMSSLVDKSLVTAETSGDQTRYRLLESTRDYLLEKLAQSGERDTIARRHAEHIERRAREVEDLYYFKSLTHTFSGLHLELDNIRAAMEWALSPQGDPVLAGSIAGSLREYCYDAGLAGEGRRWAEAALSRLERVTDPDAELRHVKAGLHLAHGTLAGAEQSVDSARRALDIYETEADERGIVGGEFTLAFGLFEMGRSDESQRHLDRAIELTRRLGMRAWLGRCLNLRAINQWTTGKLEEAHETLDEALSIFSQLEDLRGISLVQLNMAEQEFAVGNVARALELCRESLRVNTELGRMISVAVTYSNIAAYQLALGDLAEARHAAREGVRRARAAGMMQQFAYSCQHLAFVAARKGDVQTAARLIGFADANIKKSGSQRQPTEAAGYAELVKLLDAGMRQEERAKNEAVGASWSDDKAFEEALKVEA